MNIVPEQFDLLQDYGIRTGTNWSLNITLRDSADDILDLTGWEGAMEIRKEKGAPIIIRLATNTGGMTLGNDKDNIVLQADAQTTDVMPGRYNYDLRLLNSDSDQSIYIFGRIDIVGTITQVIS